MIVAVIRWSINNRIFVLMASLLLVMSGIYTLKQTPIDAIPDLSDVQVIIKTSYPGQSPQVVEDQVTYPLTSALMSVPRAKTVRGFSFFGDSYIYVIFDDDTDLYWARSRVLEYLSQVTPLLPEKAKPQLGPDASGVGWVYAYALTDTSGSHDLASLRSLQDWFLKYELQSVEGVAEVATVGGMVKQYQVVVDPLKLRAYAIPLAHVQTAISRNNQEVGASVIELAEAEYMITATGYIDSIDDLNAISLGVSRDGTSLQLKDLADVRLGPQMRRGVAELNGEGEVTGGIIVMRYGENASVTINAVKQKLDALAISLPNGVEIVPVYDRSQLIENAVDNLWQKLSQELLLVALICAVFLFHIRSSLVAVISLPLGILAAFVMMYFSGINANIMSLGGIAIAIGAMTDGAIVMIENVHKHMAQNKITDDNRWEIVLRGCSEVGPALFFSLLIITVSFLPVFILEAQEGRLFMPLAYTKTYAMAAAAGLAVTLIPVLIGYLVRGEIRKESANPANRMLLAAYRPLLKAALTYPKSVLSLAILLGVLGFYPVSKLGTEFMPPLDEGDLMYMPTTYPGISIGKARQILQQTDKIISTIPEVKTVFGKVGRAETATDPAPLTMIETFIQLKPKNEWRSGITIDDIRQSLDNAVQIPGLSNAWVMPIKTRIDMLATGIKTPLGIRISGPELTQIQQIGSDIERILTSLPTTESVYAERVAGGRYLKIDIDRNKLSGYGLSIAEVQQVIATAVGGANVTQSVEGLERYPINLRYPQSYRDSPENLRSLPIVTEQGFQIALGDVARIYIDDGPAVLKSENARINGLVFIDTSDTDLAGYVEYAQQVLQQQLVIPPNYSIEWAGQYEYLQRAQDKLTIVIPATLAIIIVLLYASFRSFGEVVIILTTLPLALIGGILLLYWRDYNLSLAVGIGFIALAGVAVEIGVLMMVYLNQSLQDTLDTLKSSKRNLQFTDLKQSVFDGATMRVRPIVMTVATITIGLLPVMLGSGTGSEVMSRIAAPMVGGMISALLLSLFVIPAIYLLWKKRVFSLL